jgi:hypothetical protein
MTDFSIPREPDPETKEDAYKLAMLAAQLDRLQNGGLDLNSAYKAWQESIEYIRTQHIDKSVPGIEFSSKIFKIYTLEEGLKLMEINPQNWKNTFSKKFDRLEISKDEAKKIKMFWEKCGIPEFHVEQFRNEKSKPIPEEDC